jgi:hypothetical protein
MIAFLSNQLVEPGFGDSRVWDLKNAPADTTIDFLLKPETWAHHSGKLKTGDEIIVKPLGLPYRAHLIVMEAGKTFAKLRILTVTPLNDSMGATAAELPANAPVEVKWNGPKDKYTVFRKSDSSKLQPGFAIKAEAVAWAIDHATAMAA